MAHCQYPNITVKLTDSDGNAFAILGAVSAALRRGNVNKIDRDQFYEQATAGDYGHLLQTVHKWVNVR